ncbi:MAG: hypothetical protein IKB15_07655 [Alistipes sp.]|nr:hypothetical protein [Alistipes sp.]
MKNFTNYFIATLAIVAGFAMSACTPDNIEDGKKGKTSVELTVGDITPNGATITVTTEGIKQYAYIKSDEPRDAAAIFVGGEKVTIEATDVATTKEIKIQGLEPNTSYNYYFAFRKANNDIYDEVKCAEFTTTGYGDNVLTVVERKLDGFAIHVQVPEEVKERGNALRYSTSSLPMYNYSKIEGGMELDMLLYNAQQFTTEDKTVRYDEYHSYERDEDGNVIENGAAYSDPKVPGEPGVFLIGEYGYMDDPNEMVVYMDGEVKTVSVSEEDPEFINYISNAIWSYPAGWSAGYYMPMYDWKRWIEEAKNNPDSYDPEKYWTGYYEKLYISTQEPETLAGNVEIKVTDKTPIDACITFTPSDDVLFYNYFICTESEYQNQIMPLLDNNEEHLRWFVGSYFAMMTFGTDAGSGVTEQWLKDDWFLDTKGLAGQQIRVLVSGIGDNDGTKQCFNSLTFTMPEVTLPKPDVVITPIEDDDPYIASFLIKNPDLSNPITEAYFACNYVREFDQVLKEYSYTQLLQEMGNPLHVDKTAIEQINSEKGFVFSIASRENATTRLAMLVYNWEGSGNNPDTPGSQAVAEYTTPKANYPVRVNSDLFTTLCGEWEATAPMKEWVAETEESEGYWKDIANYTSPITIASGIEYPETLSDEVYDIYEEWGISRDKTDELYEEFVALAKDYNNRTRGFNRLLCLGFNFADPAYMLNVVQTPYDLFISDEFSSATVADMFYDFGPKWNLEIDQNGKVWLPINIEREFPMSTFYYGIDYTFYMLAVGEKSYMGSPVYNQNGELICDSKFPVEVSEDGNTITIKPIIYNYKDSAGNDAVETYYPCVAQLQYGMATPLNPRVNGDIVLKRKGASAQSAKANASVGKANVQSVESFGEAPQPMQRTYSMTPLTIDPAKVRTRNVRETPIDNSEEAYHARVRKLFKQTYGFDFPAKEE